MCGVCMYIFMPCLLYFAWIYIKKRSQPQQSKETAPIFPESMQANFIPQKPLVHMWPLNVHSIFWECPLLIMPYIIAICRSYYSLTLSAFKVNNLLSTRKILQSTARRVEWIYNIIIMTTSTFNSNHYYLCWRKAELIREI